MKTIYISLCIIVCAKSPGGFYRNSFFFVLSTFTHGFVGSPIFLGLFGKTQLMHGKYELMHAWQQFWNSCVFLKHLVYSFEWQTSRTVLILRRTVRFTLICTVAYYLVITIMIKYYLLLVLMVVYNTEWCIWCCFCFVFLNCFQTVAKIKQENLVLYGKDKDSSRQLG